MKKTAKYLSLIILALSILLIISACAKVEFKLNFIVDGEVYATIETNGDEVISIPDDPVKEGAVFEGWYWDEGTWMLPFTANSLLNIPLTNNISVYAKFRTANDATGTELRLEGFTLIETESLGKVYYISLPNSIIIYDIASVVTVDNRSSWSLSTDLYGNNTIASKRVDLSIGDNIYYILVTDRLGQLEQYTLLIRRRPMYQVHFITKGGTECDTQIVEEGYLATEPETSREGYTFAGWNWDFSLPIVMDTWVTASWTANEYTITYDANGGTVTPATQKVTYGSDIELATPTREGYTFLGWLLDGYPLEESSVFTWNVARDVTLVAAWSGNRYQISYELNGGINDTNNPKEYNTGNEITLYAASKTGYTFNGWHEGSNFYTAEQLPLAITLDYGEKIFEASWTANTYNVTFNANGGECSVTEISATYDSDVSLPTPTRTGYEFDGWYHNTDKITSGSWQIASDCMLVAHWTPISYTISYNLAGGTNDSRNPSAYTIESDTFTICAPTRTGYTFSGWLIGNDTQPVMTPVVNGGTIGELSFTATWTPNTYTVTFDCNKGESVQSIVVTYDTNVTLPTAERVGYTFKGWYYNGKCVDNGVWTIAQNVTLIANWEANTDTPYTVNHYIQNVEDAKYTLKETETFEGTSDATVTPATKTYTGFTSPESKSVTVLADGSLVVDYYYKRNSYTVHFVTNGGEYVSSFSAKYESTLTLPSVAVREGFTFGGWFENANLSMEYNGGTMPAYNKTFYAWWTEETKPTDLVYREYNSYVNISGYKGNDSTLWIPSYIANTPVTTIDPSAIQNATSLTKVVVPDTVTSIGNGAFKGCSSIEDITLPFVGGRVSAVDEVSVFGYIFGYTAERSSTGPSGTVFQCEVKEGITYWYYYYIPRTIRTVNVTRQTEIPVNAFYNCDFIEHVTLPEDATSIGANAFFNCGALSTLNSNTAGEVNIPVNVQTIKAQLFYDCRLIEKVTYGSITGIGERAFRGCEKLSILNGEKAGEYVIPDTVTSIGYAAFYGCNLVEDITLPFIGVPGTTSEAYAVFGIIFGYTSTRDVKIPDGTVNQYTYNGEKYCYYIPNTIRSVTITRQTVFPEYAFNNCDFIEHITLPENTTSIGTYAFYNCAALSTLNSKKAGEFNIPAEVTSILEYTFRGCVKAEVVTVGPNLETIGAYAFYGCAGLSQFNSDNAYELIIPNGVKSIGNYAFRNAELITKLKVSDTVTYIGCGAFMGCSSLIDVTLPFVGATEHSTTISAVFGYIFGYTSTRNINPPTGTVNQYTYNGEKYCYYIPNTIRSVTITRQTEIPENAFYNCDFIEHITLPDNTTNIGAYAFYNCAALESIYIKASVQIVGEYAFDRCTNLTIYCEADALPANWDKNWNPIGRPVTWGYKEN